MQASTHKTIVRGACGCAAAGAVLMVVVWILAINYARSPRAGDEVHRAAVAALDTLARAGWPATTVVFEPDGFALPDPAATEVVRLAGREWSDTTRPAPSIAFGDIFPAGARARQRWLQAGRHAAVDSFLALRTSVARAGKVSEVAPIRCSVAARGAPAAATRGARHHSPRYARDVGARSRAAAAVAR